MSSRGSPEQYISELEEQLQELLEKNEELEKQLQQQDKDKEVLEDALTSARKSRDWAEGEKEELTKQLAKKEAERREAVGVQVLEKDEYTSEIEGLHDTLDGLRVEYSQKLEFMNSRCSKHAGKLLAANAKLEERTREVKELRAQLGVSPQELPPAEEEEERKKSWSTDFSTDFGGPVAFGDSATRTLADELGGDEFSSEPGSSPSSSRPHSPTSAASPSSSRPHSPTSAASPAPSASYDSDDGSNATGVTYDDDNRPNDTDDGTHATGLTHDDDHDTSSHHEDTVEHEDAQIEQDEPTVEQDEPAKEQAPAEEEELATEDQPAEEAYPEEETTEDQTTAVDDDDEQGFTGSEFLEDDSTELQDQPVAGAGSPYGPLKSLLMQERPLAFDDHNPYEEAFRPASPPYGQPDSDAAGPSDALQAVQMFPQERKERNNLARQVQAEKTKLSAVVADLQQEKTDEVQAVKDSMNDYLEELDARRIQDLQDADLRRVQDLEAADARRLTDLHEAQSKIIGMWKAFAERIRLMLQYSAALETIVRQQGVDVSYLEDRRPDAKRTEDELNEMASRNDLVVSPMRLADIHPKELVANIPSIRISPPSEESSPTTTAPPPNSPTSDGSPTSPTSTATTTTTTAAVPSCPRLHVWLWPLLAFLFTLLTLFWFAGLSEAERKLWQDANDGARLSTLGHFGYGGRLSYKLFTPVSRTLYSNGGYLPDDGQQQQQVWMHPVVRISAALVEPVFASVQVVVAGFAVVLGCLVGLR